MNERILEAIKTLKKHQDLLQDSLKEINDKLKKLEDYKDYNESTIDDIQKSMMDASLESGRYSIIDGEWYYYGKPMGVKAIGIDGKDGKQGLQGIPGKDGKDGKPGKDGKDGKPGKNGIDGKDGKPGKDGIDGEAPVIRIGKVESSEENGGAKAILKRKKGTNEYVLDLTLPRGPRGFAGFDGKPGKDGTLVFEELTDEQKEELRGPQGPEGPQGEPGKDGVTPDMSDYYNKSEIDNMIGDIEALLKEV